jgi:hypothetical protein
VVRDREEATGAEPQLVTTSHQQLADVRVRGHRKVWVACVVVQWCGVEQPRLVPAMSLGIALAAHILPMSPHSNSLDCVQSAVITLC